MTVLSPLFSHTAKKHSTLIVCLFLVAAAAIVYGQMLKHDFVYYDDNIYVTDNDPVMAGMTAASMKWAFTTFEAEFWHPLTWLSLMLDTQLFGVNPSGYLFTNLLLHIFSTLLLFFILSRTTRSVWQSGMVAALFALHPLHVESVAWIAERKDVLSTFFWMLTMLFYVYYVERPRLISYLAVLLFLALGLMAKTMLVTLPFVLILFDYWPLGRIQYSSSLKSFSLSALVLIREKIPLIVLACIAGIGTVVAQQSGGSIRSLEAIPIFSRVSNALVSYIGYLIKMLWPFKLACFYPFPDAIPWWQVAGSIFFLILISWWAIRCARQNPYFIVGWLWYLGTLVPVIGFLKIGSFAMADRYTYVSLIGISIILIWGVPELLARIQYRKLLIPALAGGVLAVCLLATWIQVQTWQNGFTLFTHALKVTSDNYWAHNALGVAYKNQKRFDAAIEHFFAALRLKPNYLPIYINLGSAYFLQNQTAEAIRYFSEAARRSPNLEEARESLGILFDKTGEPDKALAQFEATLRINPENAIAHRFMGNALSSRGRWVEAGHHLSEALRIQPDNANVHYNLGLVFENQGKLTDAIEQYSAALKINPNYADAHFNLANVLAGQRKFDAALSHYQKTLAIQPDRIQALNNLAFVYAGKNEYEKAISTLLQLAELQPDNANIYYNVAGMKAKQGKAAESINWLEISLNRGYRNCDLIKSDQDLNEVRKAARFSELIDRYCR
jgi:tetratricopeptide (TPR) repeat protein